MPASHTHTHTHTSHDNHKCLQTLPNVHWGLKLPWLRTATDTHSCPMFSLNKQNSWLSIKLIGRLQLLTKHTCPCVSQIQHVGVISSGHLASVELAQTSSLVLVTTYQQRRQMQQREKQILRIQCTPVHISWSGPSTPLAPYPKRANLPFSFLFASHCVL